MNKSQFIFLLALASTILVFNSCDKDEDPIPLEAITFENLAADPATGFDPGTGAPIGYTGKFKFFSFSTGAIVANTDSATANWDLGFRGTTIIVNSGTSGPGDAGVIVQTGIFSEIVEASETGYAQDNSATPAYAIPTGTGNGWYHYDGASMIVSPIAGKVLIIKTADGKYAKLEILSYYEDAPAAPDAMTDMPRYYTFRFVYQSDGSRSLE